MSKHKRKRRRLKTRAHIENALQVPGNGHVLPEAKESTIQVIAFGNGNVEEKQVVDVAEIKLLREKFPIVWVNVDGLRNTAAILAIGQLFNLHPLALEDVVNQHQVAKCEEYESSLFFVSRMINLTKEIESEQLCLFLGKDFVITFQEFPGDCFDSVRDRIRKGRGKLPRCAPDYLAYALLDSIVDSYFPVVDRLADDLDAVEDKIVAPGHAQLIGELHQVRNHVLLARRAVRPLRDAINQLIRDPSPFVGDEVKVYLRDCHDHCIQIIELLETYRELCSDLRDYHLSMISNRMNEIMKVLTVISTIFIPLSFIASVFGMNFDTTKPWNMPELSWRFGYLFSLMLMLMTASSFVYYFWRRGWLARDQFKPPQDGKD
jgi:magnesium transporter